MDMDKKNIESLCYKLIVGFREALMVTGKNKVVLGLSGGIDSALSAVLISKAIGAENLYTFFMPYKTSNPESLKDAKILVDKYSLKFEISDITGPIDTFFQNVVDADLLRRGNAMARMRMITLFDRAAKEDALVGGTSNKTEIILGYGTLYGDTAASINPIGSLYKKQVFEMSKFLDLPPSIINKKPSADLWEGQTDEDELGFSYAEADKLFYMVFEDKKSRCEVEKEFGKKITDIIIKKATHNSFKRGMPTVIGASSSFFGDIDRRLDEFNS